MKLQAMSEAQAIAICSWRYPAPYDIFNWPDWDMLLRESREFADPDLRAQQYVSIVNRSSEQLIGFGQLFPLQNVTRLGVGLRPDCCGLGLGHQVMRLLIDEAQRRAPLNQIDLEVLVWNARARRTHERSGFRITDTYTRLTPQGPAEFHCMVYYP